MVKVRALRFGIRAEVLELASPGLVLGIRVRSVRLSS